MVEKKISPLLSYVEMVWGTNNKWMQKVDYIILGGDICYKEK